MCFSVSVPTSKSLARFGEIIFERIIGFNPVFRNHIVTSYWLSALAGPGAKKAAKTAEEKAVSDPILITFLGAPRRFVFRILITIFDRNPRLGVRDYLLHLVRSCAAIIPEWRGLKTRATRQRRRRAPMKGASLIPGNEDYIRALSEGRKKTEQAVFMELIPALATPNDIRRRAA